ncbi:MAG TPA: hypothetical protein ENI29_16225 [bacterium]|nr:hypothetical protein [bacterium]
MEDIEKKAQDEFILPKSFSFKEEYIEDVYTDFWEKKETLNKEIKKPNYIMDNFEDILGEINQTQEVLCIITDDIASNKIVDILLELQKKNIRIYLIIEDPRDNEGKIKEEKLKLLKQIVNKILIRTLDNVNGHIILIDPHKGNLSKGLITNSRLIDFGDNYGEGFIKINLNSGQIKEGFEVFKNLFWNLAQSEIIYETQLLDPAKIKESPFKLNENKSTDFLIDYEEYKGLHKKIIELIEGCEKNLIISSENLFFPDPIKNILSKKIQAIPGQNQLIIPRLIWPDPIFPDISNNSSIYGTDNINFNFIITDNMNGVFILNGFQNDKEIHFGITLNKTQLKNIQNIFNYFEQATEYEYIYKKRLNDIRRDIEKYNNKRNRYEVQNIKNSELISIDDIQVEHIDAFLDESIQPDLKKHKKKGLKSIEYQWNLLPPYLPTKAELNKIYSDWDNTQVNFEETIENINTNLEILLRYIEDYESVRLKPFFLGKKQKLKEISRNTQKFNELDLRKINISETIKMTKILSDLCNEFKIQLGEINLEIKNDKGISALMQDIDDLNKKKEDYQSEINNFESEITQKEEILNEKKKILGEITGKKKKRKKNNEPQDNIKELKAIIKKIEQEIKSISKKKSQNLKQISAVEKNIENSNIKLKSLESSISSEKDKKKRKIDELEGFREIMKSSSTKKKLKSSEDSETIFKNLDYESNIPKESLPSIGDLYNEGKNRFLAIKYYSEIELGKEEATRLNAKLVVYPN